MLGFLLGDLSSLIAQHGRWIVALVIGLESMCLPLPGETCLVTASVYAGATGNLTLLGIIMAAAAGAVIGDSLGFWVGRSLGQGLVALLDAAARTPALASFRPPRQRRGATSRMPRPERAGA
ncbi:hypothetical protein M446_4279 [Methylobacterium sp. 4-46]|uniref:DedA family protein n=1 Tax=Methylobacterium sp. (strain 4-46) TaxID=426117 RepID=UPI000152C454|nr:hypothetical protein [Methylobacterium sp. 4-46]ACA18626.1 hypothetical protein M446_4279 [Methylobacterium sp. 4-46]